MLNGNAIKIELVAGLIKISFISSCNKNRHKKATETDTSN